MNSVLQQLFMMPAFSKGILEVVNLANDPNKSDLLSFLKKIFGTLKSSNQKFFDASPLCRFITDFDGCPLSIYEQHDADEFFNLLMDRLEDILKHTDNKDLIKNTFGGTFANEFICSECSYINTMKEEFITLNLQIHNKENVLDGFNSFIAPERLTGNNAYHCDKCNRKVDGEKFISFGILPNVLMIGLKRFEFDVNCK